jgi:hypothetical protein
MAEYDETKMQSYQLSDDELELLNRLIGVFIDDVKAEFGARARQALVTCLGNALAHTLLDHDEAFYVMTKVNGQLMIAAENHGGLPLQLVFSATSEPAA